MRWANFFALTPTSDQAGRTFSRTRRDNITTLKPTTTLLTPNKGPLKPASPLQPKNAPKTPISRPQRRRRFQSRLGRHPQRRQGFQTIGSAGRQGLAAVPVGGGETWPGITQTPRPIGGRREACGAWPGFEPTHQAKLAARTASRRAGHAAAGDLSGEQATTAGITRPRGGQLRA